MRWKSITLRLLFRRVYAICLYRDLKGYYSEEIISHVMICGDIGKTADVAPDTKAYDIHLPLFWPLHQKDSVQSPGPTLPNTHEGGSLATETAWHPFSALAQSTRHSVCLETDKAVDQILGPTSWRLAISTKGPANPITALLSIDKERSTEPHGIAGTDTPHKLKIKSLA